MTLFLFALCVVPGVTSLPIAMAPVIANSSNDIGLAGLEQVDNKTLHFVDTIKEDLRKNNDDYAALERDAKLPPGDTRRRLNDSGWVADPATIGDPEPEADLAVPAEAETEDFVQSAATVFRSFTFNDKGKHGRSKVKHKAQSTHKTTDEEDRKARVDRWKRILQKNKKLHEYTSIPKIEPSIRSIATTTQTVPHTGLTTRARMRPHGRAPQLKGQAILPFPLRLPGPKRAPPNADQLDMAPARGAYIHDLRIKGRFCHRHVLWPEGPKYDSKGNTIMPMFDSKKYGPTFYHRQFFHTIKPHFVLPRCCNCCKKSVLGCQ